MTGWPPDPDNSIRRDLPPPTKNDLAERDYFIARLDDLVGAARDSAKNWRAGLMGFVSLVTTGIVIQGHQTVAPLDTSWKATVSSLVTLGMVVILLGLWFSFNAEIASQSMNLSLGEIRENYVSLRAYEVAQAVQISRRTHRSMLIAAFRFLLLLAGILLTWWVT